MVAERCSCFFAVVLLIWREVTFGREATHIRSFIADSSRATYRLVATNKITQASKIRSIFPLIQFAVQFFNWGLLIANFNRTEAAFQTNERITATETTRITFIVFTTADIYARFNLPNSLQAIIQVFMTFKANTRTVVNDLGSCTFDFCFANFVSEGSFNTTFNLTIQNHICHRSS